MIFAFSRSLLLILMFGCASTAQKVTLNLNKSFDSKSTSQGQLFSKTVQLRALPRMNTRVGVAHVGFQYTKVPVELMEGDQSLFEQVQKELILYGLAFVEANSDYVLSMEVADLWVEEYFPKGQVSEAAKCRLKMEFQLEGKTNWRGEYWSEFQTKASTEDATNKLALALNHCTQLIVKKLVSDEKFLKLLK